MASSYLHASACRQPWTAQDTLQGFAVISMRPTEPGVTGGVKAALTPGKTWLWGQPTNWRGSNIRPSPQKAQGFRHLTLVLSANLSQFQHPGTSGKKTPKKTAWHVSMLICMWRVPELVNPHPIARTHTHTYTLQLPPAGGDLHCRNSCQGNSLSQRERERKWERGERGRTGGGGVISFWKNTASPSPAKS